MKNTIIENCRIIDGLGNPTYEGSVSIMGDRIVNNTKLDRTDADVIISPVFYCAAVAFRDAVSKIGWNLEWRRSTS